MIIEPESMNFRIDTKEERVYMNIRKNEDAYMDYKLHTEGEKNVMEVKETFLPDTLEPIGLEDAMAERLIEFADANKYKIKASCPTFRHFVNRHPEYNYLLA